MSIFRRIKDWYYNIKWAIENLFRYFKIVIIMRPWDSEYILRMVQFQLKILCGTIEKYGNEVDEDRLPKVKRMDEAIKLLDNVFENNYAERCGYIHDATKMIFVDIPDSEYSEIKFERNPKYKDYNESEIFTKAGALQEKEWNKLISILHEMRGWWD